MPPPNAAAQVSFLGVPIHLGALSLVTLTLQNSALTIVLHYSRISVPADKMYSAASAVFINECLKGLISLCIALYNALKSRATFNGSGYNAVPGHDHDDENKGMGSAAAGGHLSLSQLLTGPNLSRASSQLLSEIFSADCWKLGVPACLYVIQNNLQFVAASNLDVPTFQVTYNLKILTTALFSVLLLRRRLAAKKWLALFLLAAGVGVVQLQSTAAAGGSHKPGAIEHDMDRFKGLLAVGLACMTSGLAGVYFEMVLKGSKADLWIRNVQLSSFSLLPAMLPVLFPNFSLTGAAPAHPVARQPILAHFGFWAWVVVAIQVLGGLVTALVIKYSDNIMKGFATSLAIVLSFIAGVILFEFQVTASFLLGTCIVVGATYLYNQPDVGRRNNTLGVFPMSVHNGAPRNTPHYIPSANGSPANSRSSSPRMLSGNPTSLSSSHGPVQYRRPNHQNAALTPDLSTVPLGNASSGFPSDQHQHHLHSTTLSSLSHATTANESSTTSSSSSTNHVLAMSAEHAGKTPPRLTIQPSNSAAAAGPAAGAAGWRVTDPLTP